MLTSETSQHFDIAKYKHLVIHWECEIANASFQVNYQEDTVEVKVKVSTKDEVATVTSAPKFVQDNVAMETDWDISKETFDTSSVDVKPQEDHFAFPESICSNDNATCSDEDGNTPASSPGFSQSKDQDLFSVEEETLPSLQSKEVLDPTINECPICKLIFNKCQLLNDHMIKAHSIRKPPAALAKTPSTDDMKSEEDDEACDDNNTSEPGTEMLPKFPQQFKCPKCPKVYEYKKILDNHLKLHSVKHFPCDSCNGVCRSKEALRRHKLIHLNKDSYRCKTRGEVFKVRDALLEHRKSHKFPIKDAKETSEYATDLTSPHSKYECQKCNFFFNTKQLLSDHIFAHSVSNAVSTKAVRPLDIETSDHIFAHSITKTPTTKAVRTLDIETQGDNKPCESTTDVTSTLSFSCDICQKQFKTKGSLKSHRTHHSYGKKFKCPFCPKEYAFQMILDGHLRSHTNKKEDFPCDFCETVCHSTQAIRKHKLLHDLGKEAYKCKTCGETFKVKNDFQEHRKSHKLSTNEDNETCESDTDLASALSFSCDICQREFKSRRRLDAHRRHHSYGKKFKCSFCPKEYAFQMILDGHLRSHSKTKEDFPCDCCDVVCHSTPALRKHKLLHLSKESYKCKTCGETYKVKDEFLEHRKSHKLSTNENENCESDTDLASALSFSCDICQREFKSRRRLNAHRRHHSYEKKFKCSFCPKEYTAQMILNSHLKSHSKNLQCDICQSVCQSEAALKKHMLSHPNGESYKCTICDKTFNTKIHLNAHVKRHGRMRPFGCEICKKSFMTLPNLRCHEVIHQDERNFACHICTKTFNYQYSLRIHLKTHSDETFYSCDVCGKKFKFRACWTSHARIHKGEKNCICCVCGKLFFEKRGLNKHMMIHTGEKPYKCQFCDMAFNQNSALKSHVLTHTGEKPHECHICHKKFTQAGSLTQHKKKYHST